MNCKWEAIALLRLQLVGFRGGVTAAPCDGSTMDRSPNQPSIWEKNRGWWNRDGMASKITFFTEIEINQPGLGVQLMYWSIVNGWCCPIGVLFFCGSLKNRVVPTWKWFIYLKKKKNQPCLFLHLRVNTSIRCNSDSGSMTHYPKKQASGHCFLFTLA